MKRILTVFALILAILTSIMAGTMSIYTVKLDNIASGSVTAKEFIFVTDQTDTFKEGTRIAPGETINWQFSVRNYDGGKITETDMRYTLTVITEDTAGKQAIIPLVVKVRDTLDPAGKLRGKVIGPGSIEISRNFPLQSPNEQMHTYEVEIHWPGENDDGDGDNFGTSVRVSATAWQGLGEETPLINDEGGSGEPEVPEEPDNGIVVKYESGVPGGDGKQEFKITITNNAGQPLTGWELKFKLSEQILNCWNVKVTGGPSPGEYVITPNADWLRNIQPGESKEFGGHAIGDGIVGIENVTINGNPVKVVNVIQHPGGAPGDIRIRYESGVPGGDGKQEFKITITNNTGQSLTGWELKFKLSEQILNCWNVKVTGGPSPGEYVITPNADWLRNIQPGESKEFGGHTIGNGANPMTDVTINGVTVAPENILQPSS